MHTIITEAACKQNSIMMEFKELDNSTHLAMHISRNITEQMQYCKRLEEIIKAEKQSNRKLEVEVKHQEEIVEKTRIRLEDHKRSFEGLQGVSQATLQHLTDEEMKWNSEQERLDELDIEMKKTMEEKENYYNSVVVALGDNLVDPAAVRRAKDAEKLKDEIQKLEDIIRERRKDILTKQKEEKHSLNKLIVEVASTILMIRKEEKMLEEEQMKKKSAQKSLEALKEKHEKALREQEMLKTTKTQSNKTSTLENKDAVKCGNIKKYSSVFARNTVSSATALATSSVQYSEALTKKPEKPTQYFEALTRKPEKPGKFNFNRFQLCMKGRSSQSKPLHGTSRPFSHLKAAAGRPSPLARGLKSPVLTSLRLKTCKSLSNSPVIPRSWTAVSGNFTKHQSSSLPMNMFGKNNRKETQSLVKEASWVNKHEKEGDTASPPKEQAVTQPLDVASVRGTEMKAQNSYSLMEIIQEEETSDQVETEDEQSHSQELVHSQGFEVSQPEEFQENKVSSQEVESQCQHLDTDSTSDRGEKLDESFPKLSDGAGLEMAPSNSQNSDVNQEELKGELQDVRNSCSSLSQDIENAYEQSSQELNLDNSDFQLSHSSSVMECENKELPQHADLNNQSSKSSESSSVETATQSGHFPRNNVDLGNQGLPIYESATILERTHNVSETAQEALKRNDSQKSANYESAQTAFPKESINSESIMTSFPKMNINSKTKVPSLPTEPKPLEQVKKSNIVREHRTGSHSQKHLSPLSQSESSEEGTHLSPLFSDSNCKVVSTPSVRPTFSGSTTMGFPFSLGNTEGDKTPDFNLNFGGSLEKQDPVVNSALDLFASPGESDTSKSETINFSLFGSCSSQESTLPRNQFSFSPVESGDTPSSRPFFSLFGGEDTYSSNTAKEGSQSKFCLF